jgi:D-alanyl-D-alanine carboxypeptidase
MKKILAVLLLFVFALPLPAIAANLTTTFEMLVSLQGLDSTKQAACAQDATGRVVSYNEDMRIVPASVTKLYLFDYALSKLPINFRYVTPFFVEGTTVHINGSGDPMMATEHIKDMLGQIQADGTTITAISVSPHFYFNMSKNPATVRAALQRAVPNVHVVSASTTYEGEGKRYQFESIPIPAFLKKTSNQSNNFYSDVLFEQMGGSTAFNDYLLRTYGVGAETASFHTGSGLRGNYTTCSLTLRMLEHLDKALRAAELSLTDVMSVPVVDPGVMSIRGIEDVESLVAKSGYVNSHRNLAGIINSDQGHVYFAIFATYNESRKATEILGIVDAFTNQLLAQYRPTLVSFEYTPDFSVFDDYQVR